MDLRFKIAENYHFAQGSHQSAIAEAHHENREMRQNFLRDFYKESTIKKMGFQLMKNVDTGNLMKRFASQLPLEVSSGAMGSQRDAKNSQDLKYGFQDYTFKALNRSTLEEKPSRYLHIPQREVKIRDAIGANDLKVQPPDLEVKNLSPYRENYFQILSEEPKPFNLKRGLFTNFVDEKLPFDRERKSYDPDKEYSLHGRRSSSKDLTSIYYRAHTISKDRT